MVSGRFTLSTGRNLRDLEPPLLYDVAYFVLSEQAKLYKDQMEAAEKLDDTLKDLLWEEETGLPAIAQFMPPADASYPPMP